MPEPYDPPYAMPLKTLANVRSELARLYRGALNHRVAPDEMSRLVFALRELRCFIESMEQAAARNEVLEISAAPAVNNVLQIICVPRGAQYRRGLIEYGDGSTGAPPPFEALTPTPDFEDRPAMPLMIEQAAEPIEPLSDVAVLDSYRRRRADDDGSQPGAA
jgi:hypothetical protein